MSILKYGDRIQMRLNSVAGKDYATPGTASGKADEVLDIIRGRARCTVYPVILPDPTEVGAFRLRYQLHFHNFEDLQDAVWIAGKGHFCTN